MERRQAIQHISLLLGGTMIASNSILNWACSDTAQKGIFSEADILLLGEIAHTIIPTTDTPGAREAGVGPFIALMVKDCYTPAQQRIATSGLVKINDKAEALFSNSFLGCKEEQRIEVLSFFDKEQLEAQKRNQGEHFFTMLKQLTLLGYFTSEQGATKAVRYAPVPGRYDGCIDYKKGDKIFVQL